MSNGVKSLRAALRGLNSAQTVTLTQTEDIAVIRTLLDDWQMWARPDQLPPQPDLWRTWLILGGRGSGKTRAGAEWIRAKALGLWGPPVKRLALIGPSLAEARAVMIEGVSGLLSCHAEDERPHYEPTKRRITWPNGAVADVISGDDPETLRGPQFEACWCDELCKWKYASEAWDMLQFALRLGEHPQAVVTTTPRVSGLLKKIIADETSVVSRSATADNAANLAPRFLHDVEARYGGTRLGRQELLGEIIEDDPDALFKREMIETGRVTVAPPLRRIVVAVDPPAGFGARNNACGIVVVGLGADGKAYVLEDATVRQARPGIWARRVVNLYHAWKADRVVAEVNQGGAMVEQVLREVDAHVSFKAVHASRGKYVRAEPVAALYEQGRVVHVGAFAELEDEMCSAITSGARSPDRLDALVWAVSELQLGKQRSEPRVRVV